MYVCKRNLSVLIIQNQTDGRPKIVKLNEKSPRVSTMVLKKKLVGTGSYLSVKSLDLIGHGRIENLALTRH